MPLCPSDSGCLTESCVPVTRVFAFIVKRTRFVSCALHIGLIFSIFLIKTTKFEIKGEHIFMKPSKAFIFILVGLLAVRVALKSYLSQSIDLAELSGMFFLLAFAMIVSWRIAMYRSYAKLEKTIKKSWNF
ncbi:CcdC family protein [Bacillus paranthracis]